MSKVEIYTKDWCSYCARAKDLLHDKGIAFEEIDITHDTELQSIAQQRSGRRTVPQIFVDDTPIGGFDDLAVLNAAGELDGLAAPVESDVADAVNSNASHHKLIIIGSGPAGYTIKEKSDDPSS